MTKVKICGITNLEDAVHAVNSGADALGFNFYWNSPRYVLPDAAAEIIRDLPDEVMKVGVFVNEERGNISALVDLLNLDAVQLHGDENAKFVKELRSETDAKIIKAFRVGPGFNRSTVQDFEADFVLLDAYSTDGYGGTGESFDWKRAIDLPDVRFFLAGGLSPENVAEAVKTAHPYGVDVASGVESVKGKKDPKKVEAFIRNAKSA
jgi:phosphoribosylanthranilate isomerase